MEIISGNIISEDSMNEDIREKKTSENAERKDPIIMEDGDMIALVEEKTAGGQTLAGAGLAFISSVMFTVCGLVLQQLSLNVSDVLLVR